MGRGRGRQVSLRQYVEAVPRLKRQLAVPVAHGLLLGPGGRCSNDHRSNHPHHRLHFGHCGDV